MVNGLEEVEPSIESRALTTEHREEGTTAHILRGPTIGGAKMRDPRIYGEGPLEKKASKSSEGHFEFKLQPRLMSNDDRGAGPHVHLRTRVDAIFMREKQAFQHRDGDLVSCILITVHVTSIWPHKILNTQPHNLRN